MKILFNTYPMAFQTPGGGELQISMYYKFLKKKNIEVDFFNLWNHKIQEYDLIHFFSCISGSIHFCNYVKNILRKPLCISSSLWLDENNLSNYPISEIKGQLDLADLIITNSDIESLNLSKYLDISIDKFATIYNGVDSKFISKNFINDSKLSNKISDKYILCVGNIEHRKNQLTLAKCVSKLDDVQLILVGGIRDANYFNEIKLNIPEDRFLHIEHLEYASDLLISLYDNSLIHCMPSTLETPGLSNLEAYARGCNCIVSKNGSTYEYFNDNVSYVDPFSESELLEIIEHKLKFENKFIINEHKVKKELSDKYLWDNIVEKLIRNYKNVINNNTYP